jgi:hypothetical protein
MKRGMCDSSVRVRLLHAVGLSGTVFGGGPQPRTMCHHRWSRRAPCLDERLLAADDGVSRALMTDGQATNLPLSRIPAAVGAGCLGLVCAGCCSGVATVLLGPLELTLRDTTIVLGRLVSYYALFSLGPALFALVLNVYRRRSGRSVRLDYFTPVWLLAPPLALYLSIKGAIGVSDGSSPECDELSTDADMAYRGVATHVWGACVVTEAPLHGCAMRCYYSSAEEYDLFVVTDKTTLVCIDGLMAQAHELRPGMQVQWWGAEGYQSLIGIWAWTDGETRTTEVLRANRLRPDACSDALRR